MTSEIHVVLARESRLVLKTETVTTVTQIFPGDVRRVTTLDKPTNKLKKLYSGILWLPCLTNL